MAWATAWSLQWPSTRAPQSFTCWAQLAGAKGMADRASMGMSFWFSPMHYPRSGGMDSIRATLATIAPLLLPLSVSSSRYLLEKIAS